MKRSMSQRGFGIAIILAMSVSLVFAAPDQSQPAQGMGGGQFGGFGGMGMGGGQYGGFGGGQGMGNMDLLALLNPTAIQKRMLDAYKRELGVTDEEWAVIEPRMTKVLKLSQDTNSMTGMINRLVDRFRRGQNIQAEAAETDEQSAVQKAMTELQDTLQKEAPSSAEIKAKMAALRGAMEKVKQQLLMAEQELKDVLTLKQEATLLMLGLFD